MKHLVLIVSMSASALTAMDFSRTQSSDNLAGNQSALNESSDEESTITLESAAAPTASPSLPRPQERNLQRLNNELLNKTIELKKGSVTINGIPYTATSCTGSCNKESKLTLVADEKDLKDQWELFAAMYIPIGQIALIQQFTVYGVMKTTRGHSQTSECAHRDCIKVESISRFEAQLYQQPKSAGQ